MGSSATNAAMDTRYARNMPLLTELGWSKGVSYYKHGATNGAVPPNQDAIPPKTATNPRAGTSRAPHAALLSVKYPGEAIVASQVK